MILYDIYSKNIDGDYIKEYSGKILYKINDDKITDMCGRILYKIDGNYVKEYSGRILLNITTDQVKTITGQIIARYDSTYIKSYSGMIQYRIDGFLSRRQVMAILTLLYAS